jgi:hypothetical protein
LKLQEELRVQNFVKKNIYENERNAMKIYEINKLYEHRYDNFPSDDV